MLSCPAFLKNEEAGQGFHFPQTCGRPDVPAYAETTGSYFFLIFPTITSSAQLRAADTVGNPMVLVSTMIA